MDVTDANLNDECFGPTIVQFEDGEVYLNAGKISASITKVNGLEGIKRFAATPVKVSLADVSKIDEYNRKLAAWERSKSGSTKILIRKLNNVTIDGKIEDWGEPGWVTIHEQRFSAGFSGRDVVYHEAALGYDEENLYVAIRSRGRNILNNAGGPLSQLFTTGGALDIHLATQDPDKGRKAPAEGDVRLLIAKVGENIQAARFRPVVPGTTQPVEYYSEVAQTTIDQVEDVSDRIRLEVGRVVIKERGSNVNLEQVEIAIPLAVLGWNPKTLPETIGDIGILTGDGGATVNRVYWHNKATGIVSDMPSEARLQPSMWGTWTVSK